MKNLRIASLDAQRPLAEKDCQTCTRRRIRCDRTYPTCQKCQLRNLQCPGYHLRLRWIQGTSRLGEPSTKPGPTPRASIKNEDSKHPEPGENPPALITPPSLTNWSSETLRLVGYFQNIVVPRLRWVDGPDNPWRTILLPLAHSSPSVLYSMMSISTSHLSMKKSATSATDEGAVVRGRELARVYKDKSLVLLNRQLRDDSSSLSSSIYPLLATMFALCHAEIFSSQSTIWRLHLRGCRAIAWKMYLETPCLSRLDPSARVLMREVRDIDAYAAIFAFGRADGDTAIEQLAISAEPYLFCDFTDIMREVTITERQHYETSGGKLPPLDMEKWRNRLDEAYLTAYRLTLDPNSSGHRTHNDFTHVLKAHYLAGLVYSHRALARDESTIIRQYAENLVEELTAIGDESCQVFAHDLGWPLFIAGTECTGSPDRQAYVLRAMLECISYTGFWCNHQVIEFLQAYWNRPEAEASQDWIDFARAYNLGEQDFLIF